MKETQFAKNRTDLLPFPLSKRLRLYSSIKKKQPIDLPRQYWIEITNICNLKCITCPSAYGLEREKQMMDMETFAKAIDQIYMTKPRIVLHVAGDPLLNSNLFKMIDYAKRKGCWVGIHTPAVMLDDSMANKILDSSLDFISFSVDGCSAEVYEKIRVGAKFEKVKSQIEAFLDLREKREAEKPVTRIEILLMKETEKVINEFMEFWQKKKVDKVVIRKAGNWHGLVNIDRTIGRALKYGYRPCLHVFLKAAILADGTVVPCCNDIQGKLPMGNIKERPFSEIWNSDEYKRLRKQFLSNTVSESHICYRCHYRRAHSKYEQITQWILKQLFWRKG
ncbi:MAG: radical SAM protein [Elusimicrobiota bacterium]